MSRPNIFEDGFEREDAERGVRGRSVGRPAGARELGASVYELAAGSEGVNLHAHYGNEELFVVLSGTPSLRWEDGEEELGTGDVVACPRGREGMHTIVNRSSEPARVLAVSTANRPDVVIYPESGRVGVATRSPFEPLPKGGDEGVIGAFRLEDNLRGWPAQVEAPAGAFAPAQVMMAAEPLTVEPSGSFSTGSFSWPLKAFSSGRRPVVKRPKGIPLP